MRSEGEDVEVGGSGDRKVPNELVATSSWNHLKEVGGPKENVECYRALPAHRKLTRRRGEGGR